MIIEAIVIPYPNNIIVLSCYLDVSFGLTTSEITTVSIKQEPTNKCIKNVTNK